MRLFSLAVLVGALILPTQSAGKTWHIQENGSGDAPTVQAGIDSAAIGDTVLVFPGIYNEAIDFSGKDIVVRSQSGSSVTTINGSSLNSYVVHFSGGETRAAILEGFTISGGTHGIFIESSEPTVCLNVISANATASSGAGMFLGSNTDGNWSPLIADNRICQNVAGTIGGGITVWDMMSPEIVGNTICENEAVAGDGGGIFYRGRHDGGVIRDNVIVDNTAGDHGGGIQAGASDFDPHGLEIGWNLIARNRAGGQEGTGNSGGAMNLARTNAWVHHNSIVGNSGDGPSGTYGGGIVIERIGQPVVEKNIIALTEVGGAIWCDAISSPIIRNNLAWQNSGGDGVGACPTWWQTDGNIVTDPYFCAPESGDYSLAQNSPALTHPFGPLGAFHLPGCGPVSIEPTTWGRIKTLYDR